MGVNGGQGTNVHSIALQVPFSDVARHGRTPHDVLDPGSAIGAWASASRRTSRLYEDSGERRECDAAGFPNGRRLIADVVAIELRAIVGVSIPLVDPSYTPDAAVAVLTDGTSNTNSPYLSAFPYLGTPAGGYQTQPPVPAS
ncbi:MAG TPA: DUF4331 family protein [Jatrophihabitans sp.]|nr:DUF4331 family protein [Jatrophihabitans sp.]